MVSADIHADARPANNANGKKLPKGNDPDWFPEFDDTELYASDEYDDEV
jgi:hypothetical protein